MYFERNGDDPLSDFAKNLKHFRKQKKYSQAQLAEHLDYGYTAVANYESTRNEPSLDVLIRLADLLDVTTDELLGMPLKTEEQILLSNFKKLSQENKQILLMLSNTLVK